MEDLQQRTPEWLIIGRIGKPHGVHGSVLASIITDFPERLTAGLEIGIGPEDGPESFVGVHDVRVHRGQWLLDFDDLRSRETVEAWRGLFLFLPEKSLDELPEGFYYEHHLVGLRCESSSGEVYGEITGLDQGPGQTRLLVRKDRNEYLVPWVPEIVKTVDLDKGVVVLDPPSGLLDDDFILA